MSTIATRRPRPRRTHAEHAHHGSFWTTYVFSRDHKIIGIQFLFSTLLWFLVGGLLALGVRWQLAWPWTRHADPRPACCSRPKGGQISPEFYTMLFTMHATVMIFFVIIPILAGRVRQLPDPADDRRRRHGVPDAQHAQLLVHVAGVRLHRLSASSCRRTAPAAGWTGYPPLSALPRRRPAAACGQTLWLIGRHVRRRLVDDGLGQLPDHDHPDAGPRHDDVPPADDDLGHVHHRHPAGVRPAGAHGGRLHAAGRPR